LTGSTTYNGQIPTDPTTALALLLTIVYTASQLDPDQTQALIAAGGIAELALIALRLARGGR
jgi:hypothetical protein